MKAWLSGWFYGLQPRERLIVAIGATAAVLIVVWGLVVSPLRAETARLQASVDRNQRLLVDVSRYQGEGPLDPVDGQPGRDQPLPYLVSSTVGTYGLEEPRTRANGPSGVDVTWQNASFDAIVAWLVALHDSYGVDVETASITPTREPGFVNATFLLRRL
jgi:type II secretory pathway component PulM